MSVKTYTLGPIQQMVDLNGPYANFETHFSARTHDGSPFFFTVTDQAHLDSGQEMEFHKAFGQVQDALKMDGDVHQNIWLLIKADRECLCDISVHTVEIPPSTAAKQPSQPPQPQVPPHQQMQPIKEGEPASASHSFSSPSSSSSSSSSGFSVNWTLIAVIVGLAALGLYLWYGRSGGGKSGDVAAGSPAIANAPIMAALTPPPACPASSPAASPGPSLMDRLNSLSVDAM